METDGAARGSNSLRHRRFGRPAALTRMCFDFVPGLDYLPDVHATLSTFGARFASLNPRQSFAQWWDAMEQQSAFNSAQLKGDWHPADILAAVRKRGLTFKALSIEHGYHPTAASKVLQRPWRAMEQIVAEAIGVPPETVWPSRYASGHRRVMRLMKRPAARPVGSAGFQPPP